MDTPIGLTQINGAPTKSLTRAWWPGPNCRILDQSEKLKSTKRHWMPLAIISVAVFGRGLAEQSDATTIAATDVRPDALP